MYENLATLAIFAFLYSVIAGRVERSWLSGPIIFVAFGLLGGPVVFGFLDMDIDAGGLRVVADMTLSLVLFIDAANANLTTLRRHQIIPRRLLLVGLPLSIALGVACGLLVFPGVPVFELCVLATMLAATDAALGKARRQQRTEVGFGHFRVDIQTLQAAEYVEVTLLTFDE